MQATAQSFSFLTQEGPVIVPFFQRAYVWNESNWEELLADLLESSKNHFLGSLILKQEKVRTGDCKKAVIVDGQQRLTTLSILLQALMNSFDAQTQEACREGGTFHSCLFYKVNQSDKASHVKIEHSKIDRISYNQVMKGEVDPKSINLKTCGSNILKCYKFFMDRLVAVSQEVREKLFNDLLRSTNKILVVIDLDADDDEQAIFDTINSAGVRLSAADIVKNVLFKKAFELLSSDEVETLYKSHWESVFANDEQSIAFWDTPRATGRLWRDNIEILLHSISVIEKFFDPEKHSLSDLSRVYKNHIGAFDKKRLLDFVGKISVYANLYREKILVFNNSDLFNYNEHHRRLFHILNVCDVSTFHPFILHLYNKFADDEPELVKTLRKLEALVLRRTICNSETKNYNKLCKDFIEDVGKLDSILAETEDSAVESSLLKVSNKHAMLLLFWVELYRRSKNENRYDKDALKYTYTLEHVMPQKWEEHWSSIPVIGEDNNIVIDTEIARKYRNELIYSIGNMTLLKSALNTSLRNYELKRKVEGENQKLGMKAYAELGITKIDIVAPYDQGDHSWDEIKIRKRTKEISEDVIKIWSAS